MMTRMHLVLGATLAGLLSTSLTADDKPGAGPTPPKGFTALFNGKNLTGWKGHTTMKERASLTPDKLTDLQKLRSEQALKQWSVVDGSIHLTPTKGVPGVSLVTEKDYGNFELYLDWKIEKNGDSGIYLRGQPQVQIWDSDNTPGARGEDKGSGSGGLWNNPAGDKAKKPLKKADKPFGEWNTFHMVMIGDEVTIKLNDVLVVDKGKLPNYWDRGKPLPTKGPIELQYHGDPLWFKNIYIKELP